MRVEILVERLTRVLTKVPSLPAGIEEPRPEDHDGFTGGLLQLDLDRIEFPIDDVDHSVDLLGSDGPGPRLLAEEIHNVRGELFATLIATHIKLYCLHLRCFSPDLVIFLQLLMVDVPDLREFGLVVGVLDGLSGHWGRGRGGVTALVRPSHALRYQHVIQPHQLRVRGVLESYID